MADAARYEYIVDSPRHRRQIVDIAKDLLGSGVKVVVTRFNLGYKPVLKIDEPSPYFVLDEELFKQDMEGQAITLIDPPSDES